MNDKSPWQDIATAPKDGTYILIATKRHDGGMTSARWDDDVDWWMLDDGKNPEIWLRGPAPTHWMPLPPPPPPNKEETP